MEVSNSIFRLIIQERAQLSPTDIALQYSKSINPIILKQLEKDLNRLKAYEPIQYLMGKTTFFNLEFAVNKSVLIPRPETEELVEWIIHDSKVFHGKDIQILDIGTGSGCIAISLAKNIKGARLTALDISDKALETAKKNAHLHQVKIDFLSLDILDTNTLPRNYDIIVSNPPYVLENEKKQMHNNVLKYEPKKALFVEDNKPLVFYDRISKLAKRFLNTQGSLYFEINQYLYTETLEALQNNGFTEIRGKDDFLGNKRMIKATKNM